MASSKILVVEDEGIVAIGLQHKLQRLGYQVPQVVASGEQAIDIARAEHPDLVLMDIWLEGAIDGTEAAYQIYTKLGIPVIYITAYTGEEVLDRAKLANPFGYLVKPIRDSELNATIKMALYKHQAERKKLSQPTVDTRSPTRLQVEDLIWEADLGKLPETVQQILRWFPQVLYVHATSPYCRVIRDARENIVLEFRMPLHELDHYFTNVAFLRVHRSYLVNPQQVLCIHRKSNSCYELWIKDQEQLVTIPVGRSYLSSLRQLHPHWFQVKSQ